MNDPLPNLRYERKFLAPGLSLSEVLALVRRHPSLFREIYPGRNVHSLYVDSPSRRAYLEHINGASDRVKTRLRWYGQFSGQIDRPVLERKLKRGLVSGKISFPMPGFHVNGGLALTNLKGVLDRAGLAENLRLTLDGMEPAVVVSYYRRYFQSADGCFRATVDSTLRFLGVHPNSGAMTPLAPAAFPVIVELKFDPVHAQRAASVTNALPYRLARCSKYVLGIELLSAASPAISALWMGKGRPEPVCFTSF